MNNIIVTLRGRDTLDLIKTFEKQCVKRVNNIANLEFLKKCRDNEVVPLVAEIKHHLHSNNNDVTFKELIKGKTNQAHH